MTDAEHFEQEIDGRISRHDYHGVYSHGCCFHFALTLSKLYGYELAYCKSTSGGVEHCWAMKDSLTSIDIRGVMDQTTLLKIIRYKSFPPAVLTITPEQLTAELTKKHFSDGMNARLFALAEEIISTHLRFGDAQPIGDVFKNDPDFK